MSNMNDILEQSDKLKERGNALFKSGKILDALTTYNQALTKIVTDVSGPGVNYKRAVLMSNTSNCLFEIGQYDESIMYANKCIEILTTISVEDDSSTTNQVLSLNLLMIVAHKQRGSLTV